jgi:hypothetical protein
MIITNRRGFSDEMLPEFTHWNELSRQACFILREVPRQALIEAGVKPTSTYLLVENRDGTQEYLFPWEVMEKAQLSLWDV